MPLLRWKNLIINTDQIVKVEYEAKNIGDGKLNIYSTDIGNREFSQNIIRLTGFDAQIVWSALSQRSEAIIPAAPKPQT